MPLAALIRLTPKTGCGAELRQLIEGAVRSNRTEPGNLLALLLNDPDSPDDTLLFEIFIDEAAVEAHRAAPHAKADAPAIHAVLNGPLKTLWYNLDDCSDLSRLRAG